MKLLRCCSVALLVLLAGCVTRNSGLDSAEKLIWERPDSALSVLQSWQREHISLSPKEKARFSLLMSMALDKNYIDIASDSIIKPAVEYYAPRKGTERMYAYYYQGLVYKNMNSRAASICALEKAEADALELQNHLYLGLINRNKAMLFNDAGNTSAAIECSRKSLTHFKQIQAVPYINFGRLALAITLANNRNYAEALAQLDSIPADISDSLIIYESRLLRASALSSLKAPPEAIIGLYRSVPRDHYFILDYGTLALAFENSGLKDSADYWLHAGFSSASTERAKVSLDAKQASIELLRGNYKTAYDLMDEVASFQDSLTRERLAESVSIAQRDYYRQEMVYEKEKAHSGTVRLRLWTIIFVLAFLIIAFLWAYQLKKKDAALKENLATLHANEMALTQLSNDNAFLVGSLLNEKLMLLDKLSLDFCITDSDASRASIFKDYKHIIKGLRNNDKLFSDLEAILNTYCDNLMAKFRSQFPAIRDEKLKMATLFFTRIPYKTIQQFFNYQSVESLKQAKNRLRKTILESGAEDTQLFLNMLEMKKGGRRTKRDAD